MAGDQASVGDDSGRPAEAPTAPSSLGVELAGIRTHIETYPYVWASYVVVFGGLGAYSAYRWQRMRAAEREVLRLQEAIKRAMAAKPEGCTLEHGGGRGL
eukprot:TRINITY_DN35989_c0_g1_i1.p1 TRINITY_DN35989_c0_g1~~TRINITY_DN35989_c0_g1_i1.p1  ORF type:complete len:100 (-),score=6.81 TRINITY_DN35989_c0_g1_i1:1030-1329(-)